MALVAAKMIERGVAALVLLIDQHRVPLREGAALAILSRQADVMTFLQQRAERQRLAGCPVDAGTAVDCLGPVFQEPLNGAMNPEAIGHLRDLAPDVLQYGYINAGNSAARLFFRIRRF